MATMRDLLLRVQREPEFADAVRADPEAALAGFDLTPTEAESLRSPGPALRAQLRAHTPGEEGVVGELPANWAPEQPFPNDISVAPVGNTLLVYNEEPLPIDPELSLTELEWEARRDTILALKSGPERQLKLMDLEIV